MEPLALIAGFGCGLLVGIVLTLVAVSHVLDRIGGGS